MGVPPRLSTVVSYGTVRGITEGPRLPLPAAPVRSPLLTIFWHCGRPHFSSRTAVERGPGNEPSTVLAEDSGSSRVWQCWFAAKCLEFRVERPRPCAPPRFRLRPCPPSFLAGFSSLSAPEGRLGGLRLGTQGLREIKEPFSAQ